MSYTAVISPSTSAWQPAAMSIVATALATTRTASVRSAISSDEIAGVVASALRMRPSRQDRYRRQSACDVGGLMGEQTMQIGRLDHARGLSEVRDQPFERGRRLHQTTLEVAHDAQLQTAQGVVTRQQLARQPVTQWQNRGQRHLC